MKKRNTLLIASLLSFLFIFQGCDLIFNVANSIVEGSGLLPAGDPTTIKGKAHEIAESYIGLQTQYIKGTQGRTIYPFDCSGFVYRCYEDAAKANGNRPIFGTRPTTDSLYKNKDTRTIYIDEVQVGDLILIDYTKKKGQKGTHPNHVGIIDSLTNSKIYFIDASSYNEGNNHAVQKRNIDRNDGRIMGYREVRIR